MGEESLNKVKGLTKRMDEIPVTSYNEFKKVFQELTKELGRDADESVTLMMYLTVLVESLSMDTTSVVGALESVKLEVDRRASEYGRCMSPFHTKKAIDNLKRR